MATNNPGSNFEVRLLSCVQAVVELQTRRKNAPSLASDPTYLAQLEQAKWNISQVLAQLKAENRADHDYHELWQDHSLDPHQDHEADDQDDLYENTGPGSALAARAASVAHLRNVNDGVDGKIHCFILNVSYYLVDSFAWVSFSFIHLDLFVYILFFLRCMNAISIVIRKD